jgi:cytochrome P450
VLGEDDLERNQQSITLALAGQETADTTVAWCSYLLAHFPEKRGFNQAGDSVNLPFPKLQCPIADALYEKCAQRNFTSLSTRLVIPRRALQDDEVGGFRIPAGSDLLIQSIPCSTR